MAEPTDLQVDDNRFHRLFLKFSSESKALTIASVALIVTVLALLMAFMALDAAKHAKIQVEYELTATRQELVVLKNQMRLTDVYLQQNHVKMEALGIEPALLPER